MQKLISLSLILISLVARAQDGSEILKQMVDYSLSINQLQCTMTLKERVEDGYRHEVDFMKIQHHPFKIFLRQISPDEGIEVLYKEGENSGRMLVYPNVFPYVSLNLNPGSDRTRGERHHTIFEAGFRQVVSIVDHVAFEKYGTLGKDHIKHVGQATIKGSQCEKVVITNPNFKLLTYRGKAGDTPKTLAKKYKINDYRIVELNENVDDYGEDLEGKTITMPNDYFNRVVLYIDKNKNVPVKIEIYDEKGLYEEYIYTSIVLNPGFTSKDFSRDNKEYNF